MKRKIKPFALFGIVVVIALIAADHIEAPAVSGGTSDITDYYAFQGQDTENLVFVANVQGMLAPASTADASFDEDVLIEFNIDNNGDYVEDLVIQAIPRDGVMYFFGPTAVSATGLNSSIQESAMSGQVDITPYGTDAIIELNSANGMQFFAGPRDDPFFMDFTRYTEIITDPAINDFNNPGDDTFAGTNVLSIVVEVPKDIVEDPEGMGTLNTWVEAKRKQ